VNDEIGITRDEVQEIFGALADISSDTLRIRLLLDDPDLEGDGDDDEEA
jgi:hypothetical protein